MRQVCPRPERPSLAPSPPISEPSAQQATDTGYVAVGEGHASARSDSVSVSDVASAPVIPLETILHTRRHLAILGEPGAGKSTTLQFIGLSYALATAQQPVERLSITRPAVPVYLRLPVSASTITQQTVREAMVAEVRDRLQCSAAEAEAVLRSWQEWPGVIILLDGLDEVPVALRVQVRERIKTLMRSGIGRVIITSRPSVLLHLGGLDEYTLKPFEHFDRDVLPYLKGWLRVLKPDLQAQVVDNVAQDVMTKLRASPALRSLIGNPLLLRLIVQYFVTTGDIAWNRADLYRQWVTEAWARARWRGAAATEEPHYLIALHTLAWHLHAGRDNTETALQTVLRTSGLAADDRAAADLLHRLQAQTGLLLRLSTGQDGLAHVRYVFAHQTLREYLVALRLQQAWQRGKHRTWRFLQPRLHLPEWREPLALLVGLLTESEAQHLLRQILHAKSSEERLLCRDLLLTANLAVESGYIHSVWESLAPKLARALRREHLSKETAAVLARVGKPAVPMLAQALNDPSVEVRRAVVQALGLVGDAAVPVLAQALNDAQPEVRWAAVASLVAVGNAAVDTLVQALGDDDAEVRRVIGQALLEIGDAAMPALVKALADKRANVREAAARALGESGYAAAVSALVQSLRDENPWVRQAVAEALGAIGDAAAVVALAQALNDENVWVRQATARALGRIGGAAAMLPLTVALNDENPWVRQAVAEALGTIGDAAAVLPLTRALSDEHAWVRRSAARALGQIGDGAAVPALAKALSDGDVQVRQQVVEALGCIGDSAAAAALVKALGDTNAEVRWTTMKAFEQIGSRNVATLLRAISDGKWQFPWQDAQAWKIGNQAIEAIGSVFNGGDTGKRMIATLALGETGNSAALPALERALRDTDLWVRRAALEALAKIGDQAVIVPALERALRDTDQWVRQTAAEMLVKIDDTAAVLPALERALRDADQWVRRTAAEALGKIGDASAVEALQRALADTESMGAAGRSRGARKDRRCVGGGGAAKGI
ncbi:MAG TPA: hypothetical protein DEF43_06425, partial [Chloroflexus aurantiacus]|nr:hypothetical protein [Chloroflexus aurantiacus]